MAQFLQNPTTGDKHYEGDVTWEFDGIKWVKEVPTIKTENIELSDPTHPASLLTSTQTLPDLPAGTTTQLDANRYIISALEHLDDFVAGIFVGDNPPAEYKNGTLWWDSSADKLTLYMYYDPDNNPLTAAWVEASPPTSLDGINATIDSALEIQEDLLTRVGAGEVNQAAIQGTVNAALQTQSDIQGDVNDLEKSVSDIQTLENTQQGQIDTLENKVEALEGAVIDAKYKLSSRPDPNQGEFSILANGGGLSSTWAAAVELVFHEIDENGNPHNFDSVGLEDLCRIGGASGSAVYRIKSQRQGTSPTYKFDVEIVSFTDTPFESLSYDFEFTPGFDPSAYATKAYVDDQDALKVNKTGDTITGNLSISTQGQANDDGARLYLKDKDGNTNLTLFPSGLISAKNQIRVRRDTGDAFTVQDSSGSTKAKWHSDGHIDSPRVILSGGNSATTGEREIDVKIGVAGRLAYNGETRFSWGGNSVWIGKSGSLGDDVTGQTVDLDLQHNRITNVGTFLLNHNSTTSTGSKFVIKGETDAGVDNELFYSYDNGAGTVDAVNYKGRITNGFNIVNKDYVDTAIAGVDTSGSYLPLAGGELTGLLTLNNSANQQINLAKTGNADIQYQGTWIVSFQGNDTPKVKMGTTLDMNTNDITNLKDPSSDTDAVNRRSLQGAKVVASSSSNASTGGFYEVSGKLYYKMR